MCSHLFLPRCHRPSPNRDGSAARVCPTNYDFSWRAILEVADIPLCSGLQVCSPPRSFLPLRILPQGSRGFYIRAYRALLPPHAPGMLTVRTQVIDGIGTYTLSDSQPCRLLTLLPRPFVCECHIISTVPRFQSPPRRTQGADFPLCAHLFASRQGLWDLSCWGDFRLKPPNLVAVEQLQGLVQPLPTPPRPTEALSLPSPHQMAPNLLFHPVLNVAKALAGVPNREVIHPAT